MRKHLVAFLIVVFLLVGAVYGQAKLGLFQKPCSRPISYSLGSFDDTFGLSEQEFLARVENAIDVWEKPLGLDLFRYEPNGKLKINLIYDYRQEATDKLENLGYAIDNTQSSYESLKSRYNASVADYNQLKASLEAKVNEYNQKKEAYEEQVRYWNSRGGASKNEVNKLNAQRDSLNALAEQINRDQDTLNSLATDINAMVDVLNRMAASLNLNVSTYNNIGASRGEEFEEGVYVSTGRTQEINIYEFSSNETLIRLLAHELGHALGLEHIASNADAIMYRLNKSTNASATAEDLNAVREMCGIE